MHDAAIAGQTQSFIEAFEEDIDRNSKFISGNTPGHLSIFDYIISKILRLQNKHPKMLLETPHFTKLPLKVS